MKTGEPNDDRKLINNKSDHENSYSSRYYDCIKNHDGDKIEMKNSSENRVVHEKEQVMIAECDVEQLYAVSWRDEKIREQLL